MSSQTSKLSLEMSICKLSIAGEQAGTTVEQMIELLNLGLPLRAFLNLIELKLTRSYAREEERSSRWVM